MHSEFAKLTINFVSFLILQCILWVLLKSAATGITIWLLSICVMVGTDITIIKAALWIRSHISR